MRARAQSVAGGRPRSSGTFGKTSMTRSMIAESNALDEAHVPRVRAACGSWLMKGDGKRVANREQRTGKSEQGKSLLPVGPFHAASACGSGSAKKATAAN